MSLELAPCAAGGKPYAAVLAVCLIVGCATAPSAEPAPPASAATVSPQPGSEALAFFIGHWDAEVLAPDGSVSHRARTHARYVLDGHAIEDDWRAVDGTGRVIFRGTSLRCYLPLQDRWVIHWVMADQPGYTYLEGAWSDGELRAEGHGFDGGGEFLERIRYSGVTGDAYEVHIDRSYDRGATWVEASRIRARRATEGAGRMSAAGSSLSDQG